MLVNCKPQTGVSPQEGLPCYRGRDTCRIFQIKAIKATKKKTFEVLNISLLVIWLLWYKLILRNIFLHPGLPADCGNLFIPISKYEIDGNNTGRCFVCSSSTGRAHGEV